MSYRNVNDAHVTAGEGVGEPVGVDTIYGEEIELKINGDSVAIVDGDFVAYLAADHRKVVKASTTSPANMFAGIALVGSATVPEGAGPVGAASAAVGATLKVIQRGRHPNANIVVTSGAAGRIVHLTATAGQATNLAEVAATNRLGYMLEAGVAGPPARASVFVTGR